MSKIRLHGTSSGYTEIVPKAAAASNTLTAPSTVGELIAKDAAGAIGITSVQATNANFSGTTRITTGITTTATVTTGNITTLRATTGITTTATINSATFGSAVTITESGISATGVGVTVASINEGPIGGRRNILINGAMNVAQRGTSDTSDVQGFTTVDRWQITWGGADAIIETHQEALSSSDTGPWAAGFRNAYKLVNGNQSSGAGAGDYVHIRYGMEAQDMASSGWKYTSTTDYVTLSFWVKSSVAQNFYGYFRTIDGTQRMYPFETGSLSANTWKKVIKTIPGDSNLQFDNNNDLGMHIMLMPFLGTDFTGSPSLNTWANNNDSARTPASTSTWWTTNDATFHLTGVQLERGPVCTPFEHRNFGNELALCQRYYYRLKADNNKFFQTLGMADVDGNTIILNTVLPVTMRAAPTALEQTGTASDYKIRRSTTQTCTSVPTFSQATQWHTSTNFIKSSHGWADGSAVRCMGGASGAYLAWSSEL